MTQLNISLPPTKDSPDFDGWMTQISQYLRDYLGLNDNIVQNYLSVKDYGAVGDGTTDDTAAIQNAINAASTAGRILMIPGGTYKIVPATTVDWEGGTTYITTAFKLHSNTLIQADPGAIFKIADGVSSDSVPVHMAMFFTNEVLYNVDIRGICMDMNGQNNTISPSRGSLTYNRYMNAQVCVSGTTAGVAARIDGCKLIGNTFKNNAGVSCIVMCQSNTSSVTISKNWDVLFNNFEEVGLDTDDHSSIFGWATNVNIAYNRFINSTPFDQTTKTGGLCCIETHGSNFSCSYNQIVNYEQGFWIGTNFTETLVKNINISNNKANIVSTFVDFWSMNLLPYGNDDAIIAQVNITDNTIEISDNPSDTVIKSFFKVGAVQQPYLVNFSGNICRSYGDDTVLALLLVRAGQVKKTDQITISNNICAGLVVGLVVYFAGDGATTTTQDIERVTFTDNDLGYLIPQVASGYANVDVYLYGAETGKVEGLTVNGLQTVGDQITTDGEVTGRATVYGKAQIPTAVTWNGITISNGSITHKIVLDTFAGFVNIDTCMIAGSGTTASGSVYPSFSGLVASTMGSASVTHTKSGAAAILPAVIYTTGNSISLYNTDATAFESTKIAVSSVISVSANFPVNSADI
jgi:hypothetical protein